MTFKERAIEKEADSQVQSEEIGQRKPQGKRD